MEAFVFFCFKVDLRSGIQKKLTQDLNPGIQKSSGSRIRIAFHNLVFLCAIDRPLFICAAMDICGSRFCVEVVKQSRLLVEARADLFSQILSYTTPLKADPYGVAILKAFNSL
jgi:hypothetical protein